MFRGIFYAGAMLAAASFAAPAAAQTFEIEEPEAEAGFLRAWEIFSDDAVHLANLRRAA